MNYEISQVVVKYENEIENTAAETKAKHDKGNCLLKMSGCLRAILYGPVYINIMMISRSAGLAKFRVFPCGALLFRC